MALTGSSWLAFWEFVEISGAIIVTAGVVGEYVANFTKLVKGKSRKARLEKISTLILIFGLAIELVGLVATSHAFNLEVAKANLEAKQAGTNAAASYERAAKAERQAGQANERAAKFELAAATLEQKVAQTSTDVANIDPLNQPIAVLTADAFLLEQGTNRTKIDPSLPLGGALLVKLQFRCSKHLERESAVLICTSCITYPMTTNSVPALEYIDGIVWHLEFSATGLEPFGSVIPPNATVRDAGEWDEIEFDAPFLPPNTEIFGRNIMLTVNSTKMTFEIPPQKVEKAEIIQQDSLGKKVRVFLLTKPVTVVSW